MTLKIDKTNTKIEKNDTENWQKQHWKLTKPTLKLTKRTLKIDNNETQIDQNDAQKVPPERQTWDLREKKSGSGDPKMEEKSRICESLRRVVISQKFWLFDSKFPIL
jgi:hypothetical protein